MLVSLKTTGRPKSNNIIDLTDPKRRKIAGENTGQDVGKLETFLDKMQPTSSTPKRGGKKRIPGKRIGK